MLINEDIDVKVVSNTVKYFNEIGYECKVGDTIKVKTLDLQKNSNKLIRYKCDKCGEIKTIHYCDYNRSHKEENDYCEKCKYEKMKKTNVERYGCENVMGSEEIRRSNYLKSIGLKEFRIISRKDTMPSDEILLSMKDFAFHKLLDEGYNWIRFDIDNGTVEYSGTKEKYEFK